MATMTGLMENDGDLLWPYRSRRESKKAINKNEAVWVRYEVLASFVKKTALFTMWRQNEV